MPINKHVDAILPRDNDSYPIQCLAPSTITNGPISSSSAVLVLPSGASIVEVGVSSDCWLLWGTSGSTVTTSTGMFMPKGSAIYRVPDGVTHIAAIQDTVSGRLSITKLI